MLTSSSQYLHPDYLQPLPTTLDAKKSPLALLAQTCSSIGKDTTPAKSLIPPIERKDVQKDKDSSNSSSRPKSGADTPSRCKSANSDSGEIRKSQHSPSSKKDHRVTPELTKSSGSGSKDSSSKDSRKSPREGSPVSGLDRAKSAGENTGENRSRSSGSVPLPPALSTATSHSTSSLSLSYGHTSEASLTDSASKPLSASHHAWLAAHKADSNGLPSYLHSASFGLTYPGYPYPLFAHPSLPLDTVSASSHHLRLAAAAGLSGASSAALSPYGVGYTRVKTASGAHTLVPVCKDPYCGHCQASAQAAQLGSGSACGAGCTQCTHDKPGHVPTTLSAAHSAALGGLPLYPLSAATPGMSSLALSSLYPHLGTPGLPPYVCNWVSGSDYCGKRFNTSEELLQHLRSHTSASDASAAALSLAGLPYGGLGLPGLTPTLPTPGSMSPDSALRQSMHYPRSLSPSSILAASRYHPYKSALSSFSTPPGASGLPGASASALPPHFYSPYALYGQRLGAAAGAP